MPERSAATGSREALELCLRSEFDDDDAVTAAQIVVGEGWRPPDEVGALLTENEELRGRLKLACEPCAECGHIDYRELDDILEKR